MAEPLQTGGAADGGRAMKLKTIGTGALYKDRQLCGTPEPMEVAGW